MRIRAKLAFVALAVSPTASAQIVRFGIRAGLPLVEATTTTQAGCGSIAPCVSSTAHRRFMLGPTVEVRLSKSLSISADALYSRYAHDRVEQFDTPFYDSISAEQIVANRWEFPAALKFRFRLRRLKPYSAVGVSVGHMSEGRKSTGLCYFNFSDPYLAQRNNGCRYDQSAAFPPWYKHTVAGIVIGGGFEYSFGVLRISPEFRYTGWVTARPGANSDEWPQAQFLLAITL